MRADDCIPRQRERGHELEEPVFELCCAGVIDIQRKARCGKAQDQIPRVDQGRRHFVEQDVAHDAAADSAGIGEDDDADDGEVPVVVGATREQRAVERVCRGGD
ncbi:MAG: hypothetical protein WBD74_00395 [Candidatus Aquilonibacter sp.]